MAGHLGNNDLFTQFNGLTDSITVMGQPVQGVLMLCQGRKNAQIPAGAKRLSVAGQDNHGHFRISLTF